MNDLSLNAAAETSAPTVTLAGLIPDARRPHLFRIPAERPILALDVSKDTLAVSLHEGQARRVRVWECPNTAPAIQRLLAKTPRECCWVLEPTGHYGNQAVDLARAAGRVVLMADARRAKAFLNSSPDRVKTDRIDTRGVGEYAAARPLPLYPRPTPVTEQARHLLSARKGLSQALSRLNQQRATLSHAAPVLEPACASLRAQIAAVDRQLAALVSADANQAELGAAGRLDAIPGIGPVTAAAAAACLQSRHFGHPDQFVAFTGLDVTVRQSGKRKGHGEISQRGDGELRRLLYLAAQANLRSKHSPFRQQYERERAKGMAHTAAVCAVARKLAKVCWSLVKHGESYDPERVYQQPKSTKEPAPGDTSKNCP